MPQRIHYEKPTNYSNKVLMGPWVEDRASYIKENYKHTTTYSHFFNAKPKSKIDPALLWDLKLQFENTNFVSQIGRNDHPNYWENFSTTYDLSYNHFPKCFGSYIPRNLRVVLKTYEPNDDYIPTFGNITKFGLGDYKREQWACEVQDPRLTYSTHYKDTFVPPTKDDYKFKRWAVPLPNSSIMDKNYTDSLSLRLRGKPIYKVPDPNQLVVVEKEKRCDPITWECPCEITK